MSYPNAAPGIDTPPASATAAATEVTDVLACAIAVLISPTPTIVPAALTASSTPSF